MNQTAHTDAEWVSRIRSGDEHAFDLIYKKHWLRLFRTACRITEDESVAEDIIQETFISFWEKGCHKDIFSIEAYLYQSVKFRSFMHLRSGAISRKHLEHLANIAASVDGEKEYEVRELEELLRRSMNDLPERCREVFYLSRIDALSNKKIAEKLHISPKTVENQITKAIKHLRLSIDKMAVFVAITCIF